MRARRQANYQSGTHCRPAVESLHQIACILVIVINFILFFLAFVFLFVIFFIFIRLVSKPDTGG